MTFAGTFDPGLGQPFPRPDGVVGFPNGLDIGFERLSPGSDDMFATPSVFRDVDPGPGRYGRGIRYSDGC